MSNAFEGEREYEAESVRDLGPLGGGVRKITIAIWIVIAAIGGGAALLWHEYGEAFLALPILKPETPPQVVSLRAFGEYQQAVAGDLRRNSEMLQAQDAELKRLSDQVLQLVMKMDLLESKARDAQAAIVNAPKPAAKKSAAKPAARISVGGAPLPPEQGRGEAPAPTTSSR